MLALPNSLEIKVADFGFSKAFEETMHMNTTCGSPGYFFILNISVFLLLFWCVLKVFYLFSFILSVFLNFFCQDMLLLKCYSMKITVLLLICGALA